MGIRHSFAIDPGCSGQPSGWLRLAILVVLGLAWCLTFGWLVSVALRFLDHGES